MSITGYVPERSQVEIFSFETEKVRLPYSSVVNKVSIHKKTVNEWKEIGVPFLIKELVYQFHFDIKLDNLRAFLPIAPASEKNVKPLFYVRSLTEKKLVKFKDWDNKNKTFCHVDVSENKIAGILCFSINKNFFTSKEKQFLFLALKIQNVVIRNLVCDLALYSNSQQISPEYVLKVRKNAQTILENAFWFNEELFEAPKKSKLQMKKRTAEEQELLEARLLETDEEKLRLEGSKKPKVQDEVEEMEVEPSRKQLGTLIDQTKEKLLAMKSCFRGSAPVIEKDISKLALDLIGVGVPHVQNPTVAIPDLLYPVLGDPMFYPTKFFDDVNFDF
jgi:hypothetical protein